MFLIAFDRFYPSAVAYANGRRGSIVAYDEVYLTDIQAFLADRRGYEYVEHARLELFDRLDLLLLLHPSLLFESAWPTKTVALIRVCER